jgi:energy-coupling factor transport system substrate-specific component
MRTGEKRPGFVSAADIALVGMMAAMIEACKVVMAVLPNIELTSFWVILFALVFGRRVYFVVPVFTLMEGLLYGFGMWWFMYLYAWPLLALTARLLRKMDSALNWAVVSGVFGLLFGLLCSIPYGVVGAADGLAAGVRAAFVWWVAGIPFDLIHGASNFVLMLVLYRPMRRAMEGAAGWSTPRS